MRLALFVPLLVALAACSAPRAMPDADAAREAIAARAGAFSAAYVAGDIEAMVELYTTDGMAAPGGRDFIEGRDALRRYWTLPENVTVLRHETTSQRLDIDGRHAYDWGIYSGQTARDGTPQTPFRGKYLIVWRLDDDGRWRMLADMWNRLPE